MKCPSCGKQNSSSAKFCKYCGYSLEPPLEGEVVEASQKVTKSSKKDKAKEIAGGVGGCLLYLVGFVAFIIVAGLFFKYAPFVIAKVLPVLTAAVILLLILELCIVLPMALSKKLKGAAAVTIYIGSYVYGVTAWMIGFITTLAFWGWFWVIVGLFIAGIGVVPFGLIAAALNKRWDIVASLVVLLILTYGSRMLGAKLAEDADVDI